MVLFAAIWLVAIVLGLTYSLMLNGSTNNLKDTALLINDYQQYVQTNIGILVDQTAAEQVLIDTIVGQSYNVVPFYLYEALIVASTDVTTTNSELSKVQNDFSANLYIPSKVDTASHYQTILLISTGVIIGVIGLFFVGEVLFSILPDDPNREAQFSLEAFTVLFFVVLGCGFLAFFGVPIVSSDFCQDPNAYFLQLTGNTAQSQYYLYCPVGGSSPSLPNLQAAYTSLNSTIPTVAILYNITSPTNSTLAPIHDNAAAYLIDVEITLEGILLMEEVLNCTVPHGYLVGAQETFCYDWTENIFILGWAMYLCPLAALLLFCILPRQKARHVNYSLIEKPSKRRHSSSHRTHQTSSLHSRLPNR